MKPYPTYKDSGIEWIGEIPDDWELIKIKYLTNHFKGLAFSSKDFEEKGIPIVKASNIKNQSIENILSYIDLENQREEFEKVRLNEGDIIISTVGSKPDAKDSAVGQLGFVGKNYKNAYLNQNTVCFRPIDTTSKEFIKYMFLSSYMRSCFDSLSQWIANQAYLEVESIRSQYIPIPKNNEHIAIANFLDHKTTQIDETIVKKEKLIELLEEERKAIINEAVTKGLDPNAKLKPSGIEWLGDIPEHWEVKKLKYVKSDEPNSFVDGPFGSNLKTEHFVENGDVYVIDSGYITSGKFELHREFRTITDIHFKSIQRSECKEQDIILSKIGANFGMSGILPILDKPSVVSGNSLKLSVDKKYSVKYVHFSLLNLKYQGQIDLLVKGSAQPALTLGLMNNLSIVAPSTKEQLDIVAFIEEQNNRIDNTLYKVQKEIELLKEYRQALIFEAVTGKIDVREYN